MKRLPKILFLIFLGLSSFVLFFYLSFPYEVLKEVVAVRASEVTGFDVNIGDMSPKLPLGVEIEKVSVTSLDGTRLQFNRVIAYFKVLDLLLGRLGVDLTLQDAQHGNLRLMTRFSILDLLRGHGAVPSYFWMFAKSFNVGDIANFFLRMQADSPTTSIMLKPLLKAFECNGKLNAEVDFSIDSVDLSKSEGNAQISFQDAGLFISDPDLKDLPNQNFEKALIKASFKNGLLTFAKESGLISQDLEIRLSGQVTQKPQIEQSVLDLTVEIQLREALKKQFSWVLNAAAKKETDGSLRLQISGALSPQPKIDIL